MKLYTKTGDAGETALFGGGRVAKADLRVEAYGTVDEANASLGMAHALTGDARLRELLVRLQHDLFKLGADLATPLPESEGSEVDGDRRGASAHISRVSSVDVARLEREIDALDEELPPLRKFILPGGGRAAAGLHLARTVVRRAERACVRLRESGARVNPEALRYLNRLSDLCFVLARAANLREGEDEVVWEG